MKFGLLGSLEVVDDQGAPVDLGGTQARTVLAMVLAASGRVVSTDRIIDEIWADTPPSSALGTLQSYVSRLRRSLEPDRAPGAEPSVLRHEPPGYRLAVDPDDADHRRFERLADEGRALLVAGRHPEARAVLGEALGLWRGPALAEYRDHEFAAGLATRLESRRLATLDDRIAADLALGGHAALIGELEELVAEHPLQEGLRVHLALALYRTSRQAEALRTIDAARRTLRDELGVEPGRSLRDLEAAILAHDPALDAATVPAPKVAATPSAEGPSPLVGRVAELDELERALDEATTSTRATIVEGEPGIGKTRLAEELAAIASARGATVLWGRAFEGGAAPAYWPWLDLLRELAHGAQLTPQAREELGQVLSPSVEPDLSRGEAGRYALLDAVVELLHSRGAERPLVVVLDDLQWADVSSLDLLNSVASRLVDVPLLIVVTVRELDVGRNDELVESLAALTRRSGTRRILLRGLSSEHTAALVQHTTGDAIDPALLPRIHGRAEGNPFYVTELARLLATGNPLDDVPSGVRDVVRRRLAQLPERTGDLLQVAAVIGRGFDLALLARAAERDLDDCLDDLDPAVVRRLLAPVPDQPSGFRFAHALVREVVADGMSALARARMHLRVADAMEDTDDTAEIRAEHLWNASAVGAGGRAADALERAAEVAIRRRSLSAAERLLERAVPLRRASGSTLDDRVKELRTIELLVSVIGARRGQANLIDSPLLARGKALALETGLDQRLQSLLWIEWAGLDQAGRLDQADPIAAELLARAERDGSPLSRLIGHESWGIHLWHHGHIADAAHHFDAAVEAGSHLRPEERYALLEPDQLRLPQPFSTYVHELMGDWDDPDERFRAVVQLLPGDPYWELVVCNFAAWGALATGHFERAERIARRAVEVDPEGFSTFWSMQVRCCLGIAVAHQGGLDEGLAIIDAAWTPYAEMGLRVNGGTYFTETAIALLRGGRVDEADAALVKADEVRAVEAERYGDAIALLARAVRAAAVGDRETARDLLGEAHRTAIGQGALAVAARIERDAQDLGMPLST